MNVKKMGTKITRVPVSKGQPIGQIVRFEMDFREMVSSRNVGIALKETFSKENMEAGFGKGLHGVTPKNLEASKKKGKWKRWAREGGRREAEPEGELVVERKRFSDFDEGKSNMVVKKLRPIDAFG
ncbi:hypothetical protein QYF36_009906 [Acer negundo]|nr:hypothetical protein QYF36_009906 [Acer negundo]